MNYALIGYGRMGRAIEEQAARRGHRRTLVIDAEEAGRLRRSDLDREALGGAEIAFEFSLPDAAADNVRSLVRAGVGVVCGTTGWRPSDDLRGMIDEAATGVVIAPNFSVGMFLFRRVVRRAARDLGRAGLHRPYVFEAHHVGKRDAPSGTARELARVVLEEDPRIEQVVEGNPAGMLPERSLHVASLRVGHEPGTHTVGFDGEHDRIELTHRASGRSGFALGAVLAAEWLVGKRGMHGFEKVVEALIGIGESG